jgi:hypothetical protein
MPAGARAAPRRNPMSKIWIGFVVSFACVVPLAAQSEPPPGIGFGSVGGTSQSSPPQSAEKQVDQNGHDEKVPNQKAMEKIVFARRSKLPESPKPKKSADEGSGCAAGEGNPCALLGGRPYFREQ